MKRIMICFAALLLLWGCAENPDSDIIVHKDMDKVIDEAQQNGENKADVEALRQYDSYTADIQNDSLRVSIHADAQVDIPQTDKLSISRVKQHEFTQDEIDAVRQALLGDTVLYDGVSMMQDTKADIEKQIGSARAAFIGSRKDYENLKKKTGVLMAVNAIDGSVIDSILGY